MKEYMKPEIELVKFDSEVIANTGVSGGENEEPPI